MSAQAVARSGREGCGIDCQVREVEGGESVERGRIVRGSEVEGVVMVGEGPEMGFYGCGGEVGVEVGLLAGDDLYRSSLLCESLAQQ